MIEKLTGYCKTAMSFVYDQSLSIYELLIKAIEKLDEVIDFVNGFQDQLNAKEDSINITNSRKLDENGNFTGTWFGDTKSNMDIKIINGQIAYQEVIDLIESNPELNIEFIDGGFFASTEIPEEIDGGDFTSAVTEEIDCGLFIYPCQCTI